MPPRISRSCDGSSDCIRFLAGGTQADKCNDLLHAARLKSGDPALPQERFPAFEHACVRQIPSSRQPCSISSSTQSGTEFAIYTGRPSPTQAAVLSLLGRSRRPVPRLPHARSPRLSLGHTADGSCSPIRYLFKRALHPWAGSLARKSYSILLSGTFAAAPCLMSCILLRVTWS